MDRAQAAVDVIVDFLLVSGLFQRQKRLFECRQALARLLHEFSEMVRHYFAAISVTGASSPVILSTD